MVDNTRNQDEVHEMHPRRPRAPSIAESSQTAESPHLRSSSGSSCRPQSGFESSPAPSTASSMSSPPASQPPLSPPTFIASPRTATPARNVALNNPESPNSSQLAPTSHPTSSHSPPPQRPQGAARNFWLSIVPSNNNTQNIMGIGVWAMTIATVVYSRRSDISQRWNNVAAFYQWCQGQDSDVKSCDWARENPLSPPPFEAIGMFGQKISKRSLGISQENSLQVTADTGMSKTSTILLSSLIIGALIASMVVFAYIFGAQRRLRQLRQVDQSMVRSEPMQTVGAVATGSDIKVPRNMSNRYRAFVTAESAVNGMKSDNSSTLSDVASQTSSSRWSRRRSWLNGSSTSVFDQNRIHVYDTDSEPWMKVKRASDTGSTNLSSTASTIRQSSDNLPTPPRTRPSKEIEEPHTKSGFLKRWLTPKPIRVTKEGQPELDLGDSAAAAAFVGATLAGPGGGQAVAECPVEVPLDQDKGLPDSWMHTSPQDCAT